MISTRRDLYLIMISYSNQKEVMDLHDLARFLENEQKVQTQLSLGLFGWHISPLDHVVEEKGLLREEKTTSSSVFLYRNLSTKHEIVFSFNMRQPVFVLCLGFIFISVQSIKTKLVGEGVRNESGMCRSAHPTQSLHFWKEHVPDTDFGGLLSFKSCYFNFKCSCS